MQAGIFCVRLALDRYSRKLSLESSPNHSPKVTVPVQNLEDHIRIRGASDSGTVISRPAFGQTQPSPVMNFFLCTALTPGGFPGEPLRPHVSPRGTRSSGRRQILLESISKLPVLFLGVDRKSRSFVKTFIGPSLSTPGYL